MVVQWNFGFDFWNSLFERVLFNHFVLFCLLLFLLSPMHCMKNGQNLHYIYNDGPMLPPLKIPYSGHFRTRWLVFISFTWVKILLKQFRFFSMVKVLTVFSHCALFTSHIYWLSNRKHRTVHSLVLLWGLSDPDCPFVHWHAMIVIHTSSRINLVDFDVSVCPACHVIICVGRLRLKMSWKLPQKPFE